MRDRPKPIPLVLRLPLPLPLPFPKPTNMVLSWSSVASVRKALYLPLPLLLPPLPNLLMTRRTRLVGLWPLKRRQRVLARS